MIQRKRDRAMQACTRNNRTYQLTAFVDDKPPVESRFRRPSERRIAIASRQQGAGP